MQSLLFPMKPGFQIQYGSFLLFVLIFLSCKEDSSQKNIPQPLANIIRLAPIQSHLLGQQEKSVNIFSPPSNFFPEDPSIIETLSSLNEDCLKSVIIGGKKSHRKFAYYHTYVHNLFSSVI